MATKVLGLASLRKKVRQMPEAAKAEIVAAMEVLQAAISGPEDEAPGKPAAAMETDASPPPPSMDAAPSFSSGPT